MAHGVTPSERFVTALCERSFLRLWTHPNPQGKKGKELCDCLVVCGPHVIIISVKECEYKDTGNSTGWERWLKAAITKSAAQIWGAERWLETVNQVVRHDGRQISLPAKDDRRYHRISVSLGGKDHVPIKWGDLGNGFVHVCDERSVGILFGALDTITDFVQFLAATEELVASGVKMLFDGGGIEDLAALYLLRGRVFDFTEGTENTADILIVNDDLWKGFCGSDDYRAMQVDFKDSYVWDRLIDHYAEDILADGMFDMYSKEITDSELALVEMALQPRVTRTILAEEFMEFLRQPELKVASRIVQADERTAFVFLIGKSAEREHRARELALRCFVVRGILAGVKTVVGVATDRPGTSDIGYSSDISYLYMPEWTVEDVAHAAGIQEDLGYFQNAHIRSSTQF